MYQSSMKKISTQALLLVATGLFLLAGCSTVEAPPELSTLAKPVMGTFPIENSFVIDDECDFPVLVEFTGQGRFLVFFDREGNPIRAQVHTRHAGTVTNLETGLTLRDPVHRTTFYDFVKGTMTVVGLEVGITVPGKGVVVLEAGKAVFDLATGEVLFEAGPHQFLDEGFALVCEALS